MVFRDGVVLYIHEHQATENSMRSTQKGEKRVCDSVAAEGAALYHARYRTANY